MHLKKIAVAALAATTIIFAQTPAPAPAVAPVFDVATIKPAPPLNPAMIMAGKMHVGMKIDAAKVDIGYMSISDLIVKAYDIKGYQVTGPDYMTTERFDIVAKMPEGSTKEQVPDMLKALLADRFKLTVHKETKTNPVYALIVMKGGPKLKEAVPDPVAVEAAAAAAAPPAKGERTIETLGGTMKVKQNADGQGATVSGTEMGTVKSSVVDGVIHMETSSQSITQLIDMLARFVDRPVVDETGLKGKYQIAMDISMQEMMKMAAKSGMMPGGAGGPMGGGAPGGGGSAADAASDPGSGGSVFTSLQKMGLKLDSRKQPMETIVIDHVEKTPTEN